MNADDWDQKYAGRDLVWSVGPNVFVEKYAAALPPGRALDVAGGEGRNALWLADRGWEATVADFSRVALDRASRLWEQREGAHPDGADLHVREVDVVDGDLGEQAYDLVLLCYLQVPASERTRAVRNAARAVAPGGHLLVVAHHTDNLVDGHGGPRSAEVCYTEADLVTDLEGTGLTVRRAERVARHVSAEDGEHRAWDALVAADR